MEEEEEEKEEEISLSLLTCSWTQPSTQRHRSVVEYRAYDMLVAASKPQSVLSSLPSEFPLQNRGQMFWGPDA